MDAGRNILLSSLEHIATTVHDRQAALEQIAALLRRSSNYRWVGLYDIDRAAGLVRNVTWSGPSAPEHPTFPLTKGLTTAAVGQKRTINVGDVSTDPRYLTAFGTTRSEIIVPVFDGEGKSVLGTIDIESEAPHAFDKGTQDFLEACSGVIRTLWGNLTVLKPWLSCVVEFHLISVAYRSGRVPLIVYIMENIISSCGWRAAWVEIPSHQPLTYLRDSTSTPKPWKLCCRRHLLRIRKRRN